MDANTVAIVKAYYSHIDAGKIDEVIKIFTQNILYQRGNRLIEGIDELRIFYKKERTLQGIHTLRKITLDKDKIKVEGIFEGTAKNKKVKFEFSDTFIFGKNNKVKERRTQSRDIDVANI